MRVTGPWAQHEGTQSLLRALEGAGHQALFVGGCVRNALLMEPVGDIDIATSALPETVTNIAETAGFHVIPTGIDHGTVTVIAKGLAHEVTTFRRDVETDGRRAVVAFSTRVEEDAPRRDFTMNALYADASGLVLDPLHGLPDLAARLVRFVGDPETRIREDYLRVLRFFRFYARYGDPTHGPDPDGLAACAALFVGLETISKERIGNELRKLLSALDPAPAVAAMAVTGVLAQVLPGADHRALAVLIHLEGTLPPVWERRLAVLGGSDPEAALRLSRNEARHLQILRDEAGKTTSLAALGWKHGPDLGRDSALTRAVLVGMALPDAWEDEVARGAKATFPVTAADLMPALQGEALGARLRALEAVWLASDLRASRADLLRGA